MAETAQAVVVVQAQCSVTECSSVASDKEAVAYAPRQAARRYSARNRLLDSGGGAGAFLSALT